MSVKFRKWHRYISIIFAIPMLLTLLTGSLLILRSYLGFLQPAKTPKQIYQYKNIATIQAVSKKVQAYYKNKATIKSISFKPKSGLFAVRIKENREIRLHAESLKVLSEGPKLTGLIIALHEGSFFSAPVRDFIFFPTSLALIFLLISGLVIFFTPYYRKRKRKHG